jgi:hypothetical protein
MELSGAIHGDGVWSLGFQACFDLACDALKSFIPADRLEVIIKTGSTEGLI